MERNIKIRKWIIASVILSIVCIAGGFFFKDYIYDLLNPEFEETAIFPDDSRENPADTTFTVNGIEIKMIGVKGGKINCKGLRKTIEMGDFYIGETEVTQELWASVMGENPSIHKDSLLCPVENVDLEECVAFIHKLDSISGGDFYIPSYPEWLYVAYLGSNDSGASYLEDDMSWHKENSDSITHPVKQKKPNTLGVYDIVGNVSEWTVSGSDPLFFVVGGSYETEKQNCKIEAYDIIHANVKMGSTGFRLLCFPNAQQK